MPVDTQQIMDEAVKLGLLVAQHPAVARYKQAQKSVADDPEAGRLLAEMDRQMDAGTSGAIGASVTDARITMETLQNRVVSNLKIKAWNLAQVDFVDLLRKTTQTIQQQLSDQPSAAPAPASKLSL